MATKISLLGLLVALLAAPASAQVTVSDAWVRGTVPGQKGTGAFMQLESVSDAKLVSAASPAAKVVEIHTMATEGGVMKMRAVDAVPLPAGKTVALRPGGLHVMLMDLAQPLQEGDKVPVTLTFADAEGRRTTQQISVPVRALTAAVPPAKH